jgi:hypothetical protein
MGSYSEHQLWYLHDEFGASPRNLAFYASDPADYEDLVLEEIATINPVDLEHILGDPRSGRVSHYVFIIKPSPATRTCFKRMVASQRVFELIWDTHLRHRVYDVQYFYSQSRECADDAGWTFELQMHQSLRRQHTVQLFPIHGRRATANYNYYNYTTFEKGGKSMVLELPSSDEHPLVKGDHLRMNCYYRPDSSNFPGIDSLLLILYPGELSPILLVFRMTQDTDEHNMNEEGLRKIDELTLPLGTRRCLVLVTPENAYPQIKVPATYFPNRGRIGVSANIQFPVFHYPVRMGTLFV